MRCGPSAHTVSAAPGHHGSGSNWLSFAAAGEVPDVLAAVAPALCLQRGGRAAVARAGAQLGQLQRVGGGGQLERRVQRLGRSPQRALECAADLRLPTPAARRSIGGGCAGSARRQRHAAQLQVDGAAGAQGRHGRVHAGRLDVDELQLQLHVAADPLAAALQAARRLAIVGEQRVELPDLDAIEPARRAAEFELRLAHRQAAGVPAPRFVVAHLHRGLRRAVEAGALHVGLHVDAGARRRAAERGQVERPRRQLQRRQRPGSKRFDARQRVQRGRVGAAVIAAQGGTHGQRRQRAAGVDAGLPRRAAHRCGLQLQRQRGGRRGADACVGIQAQPVVVQRQRLDAVLAAVVGTHVNVRPHVVPRRCIVELQHGHRDGTDAQRDRQLQRRLGCCRACSRAATARPPATPSRPGPTATASPP